MARQLKGWTHKLIWGDNKLILSSLKAGALRRQIEDAGGLKLIYIDPPFDVGAYFSMDIEIDGETFHKEPNLLEQIAYRDTWGRGADAAKALREPAHAVGVIFEPPALAEVFHLTKGYPYFLQEWGYQSWNLAPASPITLPIVRDATAKVIPVSI